jgi:hypothetical protein
MRRARIVLALSLSVLTGACQLTPKRPLADRIEEFMEPYEQLKQQKADLWRAGYQEQEFEFPEAGTVTVRRWELVGWPGDVYVSARVTYQNTTDTPRSFALVWLDVLDDEGRVMGTTAVRLVNPVGYPFWPGHTYTTEIRARTNDAHLDPKGWSWTVACEAPVELEPGAPPVLINHDLENARAEQAQRTRQLVELGRAVRVYQGTPGAMPVRRGRSMVRGPFVPGVR